MDQPPIAEDVNLFDQLPVEGPEDDPAAELVRELTPRPSEDDDFTLTQRILDDFQAGISDRDEWERRLKDWEDLYYGRTEDKVFPWPGASNFHVPITMLGVETYKPRLVESVLGQQPPIIAVPTTPAGEERRLKVETILNWQVVSKLKLEASVTQAAHLFLQPGLVVAKTYWKVTRQWRKFVREFPKETQLQEIFESLFGTDQPQKVESQGENTFTAEIKVTNALAGGPLQVKLKLKVLEDMLQVLVEREELTEGPAVDLIDPIDIIAPVKGGQDVNELPWIQQRMWMTEDDLRRKVKLGRFYKEAVEIILQSGFPAGDQPVTDSQGYRQSQDDAEGVDGEGSSNARAEQYQILEDYRRYDIDGDGFEEEIITWVCPDSPKHILGWDYLDNVYAHGRRPLRVGRYFPIPFRFYGLSFAEVIKGLQDEINAIHNQKVDYATIQNLPFGFKRASATLPPIQQRMKPGEFIDVDNPQQDILIPKWQGSPAWGQQEEATLMQYFERLTGLNDLTLGRQPNRVGATRTAKGTQTLLNEAGLRFKTAMQGFQRFWVGIFEDILALDQEYLPPAMEFRVTGRRPAVIKVKDRTEIRGNYDIRLATTSENLNREQMREDASILLQAIMNPVMLQLGIVGKKGVRRVVADFFKSYGKDPDFYLEDDMPVLSPQEELMRFAVGQYVSPVMGENVDLHLQEHQMAMTDPSLGPQVKMLIRKHMGETIQLKQMMMMSQMLQGGPKASQPPQQAANGQQGGLPQAPQQPSQQTPPGAGMPQGARNGA